MVIGMLSFIDHHRYEVIESLELSRLSLSFRTFVLLPARQLSCHRGRHSSLGG